MVSMDLGTAVKSYQFGERAKSELIIASQLCLALTGFAENERAGGRRMLLMLMESVRNELQFAAQSTGQSGIQKGDRFAQRGDLACGKQPAGPGIRKDRFGNQRIHNTGAGSMAGT